MSELSEKMATIEVMVPKILLPFIDNYIQFASHQIMESAQTIDPLIGEPLLETLKDMDIEKTILGTLLTKALAFGIVSEEDYNKDVYDWLEFALSGTIEP